jgi:LmbE family N-acetylglucosaminyl deacetylase
MSQRARSQQTWIPALLPHFERRGDDVYFLCSVRPLLKLTADEIGVFDQIDGKRTVAEIVALCPLADQALGRILDMGVAVLLPPPVTPVPGAPRLLVVEPHMDDAALSVGGSLLNRSGSCHATVLSVVKYSNYTSYIRLRRDYLDEPTITSLRLQESGLATRLLGADFRSLDWVDGPNRFLPSVHWSSSKLPEISRGVEAFIHGPVYPEHVHRLSVELADTIADIGPDELWIPLALGDHIDHRLVHEASLNLLGWLRTALPNLKVCFYEDIPYATPANVQERLRALQARGLQLTRETEAVDNVFDQKLLALGVYASQFKRSAMDRRVRAAAEHAAAGSDAALCEVRYALNHEKAQTPDKEKSPVRTDKSAIDSSVADLLRSRADCQRVTIIVLPSGHLGEWPTDLAAICRSFPRAQIHLLISANVAWQAAVGAGEDPRLTVDVLPKAPVMATISILRNLISHASGVRVWVYWGANKATSGARRTLMKWAMSVGSSIQVATLPELTARLPSAVTSKA